MLSLIENDPFCLHSCAKAITCEHPSTGSVPRNHKHFRKTSAALPHRNLNTSSLHNSLMRLVRLVTCNPWSTCQILAQYRLRCQFLAGRCPPRARLFSKYQNLLAAHSRPQRSASDHHVASPHFDVQPHLCIGPAVAIHCAHMPTPLGRSHHPNAP